MRLALLILCVFAGAAHAADASFADPNRLARVQALLPEVDKMYAELAAKEKFPGLVYGIVVDGKLVHSRAIGLANVESKSPVTTSTQFRIASMTKSFVTMAVLRLRDEGKLQLDDPVTRYLPELRKVTLPTADAPPLTVRMLMTMTSGLPEDNPWGDRQMALSNKELADLVGGGLSFSSAPGQAFEYSNLGYIMLGKVVTRVAGMRFQDYITRNILLPLGMNDTLWEYRKAPAARLALGYQWLHDSWLREPMLRDGDGAAMGGLITTADDFARYLAFHLDAWPARAGADNGPLKRASVRDMQLPKAFSDFHAQTTLTDGQTANPKVSFYGYGLSWTRDARGVTVVGHSGGLPGFGSQFRFAPDHGVGIFAFTNLRYGNVYGPTAKMLGTLIEQAKLPPRSPVPAPILLTRQAQVARLIQGWDVALGQEIAADNFFLDRSREDWMEETATHLARIGKVVSLGPIRAENRLRGAFSVVGEQGTVDVAFTLTPEREPKLQELRLTAPSP
ncbi:beta-lactamase family protein [Massilia sp. PAMC28688]|uniref:serine hydrolase domain-containing protein n=1 Tax=Massilia sp. PAMC28688 TaxID=2861283 RepID=UPI001C63989F|nr:serine hydrolase domain-containing protein [Massilia sp. PAMC28688]QYF95745.1 beta-lactamase family protein [Massilia sp. PAMC28688]